jgi:hypothetical protein
MVVSYDGGGRLGRRVGCGIGKEACGGITVLRVLPKGVPPAIRLVMVNEERGCELYFSRKAGGGAGSRMEQRYKDRAAPTMVEWAASVGRKWR